jgi:hypothetical protein
LRNMLRPVGGIVLMVLTALFVMIAGALAAKMAWAPRMGLHTQALKKGETRTVEVVVADHYYQEASFWGPLLVVAFVAVLWLVIYHAVSHERTGRMLGAVIGTSITLVFTVVGTRFLPDGFWSQSFWNGASVMLLIIFAVGAVWVFSRVMRRLDRQPVS